MKPEITVIMSIYNGERFLKEAIESILNQTYKNFEFLIINDGSTDSSKEIILSYNDSRIRLIDNEQNIGLTHSLNKGLKLARGKYIARMDADDISMPERFGREVDFLETHPDYAVVGTFAKILNSNSEVIHLMDRPTQNAQIREHLKRDNCIIHGSAMMRMPCLLDAGFYDESIIRAQDYELWLRLSDKYLLANIPEYLYMRRKHDDNIEAKYIVDQKIFVLLAMIKNDIIDVEEASTRFINLVVEKNLVSKFMPLTLTFYLLNLITFNNLRPSTLYKNIYRVRFSKRVQMILSEFKMAKKSFDETRLSLRKIFN